MEKDKKLLDFLKAKSDVIDSLRAIQINLTQADDKGLLHLEDDLYNQILALIDQASISTSWEELEEIVHRGKTLEVDVDTVLAEHGQTSISLSWPRIPKGK